MTFTNVGGDPDDLSGLAALAILVIVFGLLPVAIGWGLRVRDARLAGQPRPPRPMLPHRVALGMLTLAFALEVLFNWFAVAFALFLIAVIFAPPSLIPGRKRPS